MSKQHKADYRDPILMKMCRKQARKRGLDPDEPSFKAYCTRLYNQTMQGLGVLTTFKSQADAKAAATWLNKLFEKIKFPYKAFNTGDFVDFLDNNNNIVDEEDVARRFNALHGKEADFWKIVSPFWQNDAKARSFVERYMGEAPAPQPTPEPTPKRGRSSGKKKPLPTPTPKRGRSSGKEQPTTTPDAPFPVIPTTPEEAGEKPRMPDDNDVYETVRRIVFNDNNIVYEYGMVARDQRDNYEYDLRMVCLTRDAMKDVFRERARAGMASIYLGDMISLRPDFRDTQAVFSSIFGSEPHKTTDGRHEWYFAVEHRNPTKYPDEIGYYVYAAVGAGPIMQNRIDIYGLMMPSRGDEDYQSRLAEHCKYLELAMQSFVVERPIEYGDDWRCKEEQKPKRGRGRPPGSKNKPKSDTPDDQPKRGRGRPPGSKNRTKDPDDKEYNDPEYLDPEEEEPEDEREEGDYDGSEDTGGEDEGGEDEGDEGEDEAGESPDTGGNYDLTPTRFIRELGTDVFERLAEGDADTIDRVFVFYDQMPPTAQVTDDIITNQQAEQVFTILMQG